MMRFENLSPLKELSTFHVQSSYRDTSALKERFNFETDKMQV